MTAEEALALMESAKDVYQWNQFRRLIKYNIEPASLQRFLTLVDAYGLIRKVAKANNWPKVYTYSYGWILNKDE
jgi:hypothetical protein